MTFPLPKWLILFLIAIACPQAATAAEPAGGPTLIVLFDSSGSMWGPLPGGQQPKYAAARDALLNALPALHLNARTGLVTFGRGCSSIDVVLPPDIRPQDRTIAPLNALNPRGKGPLGQALLRAAEQIEPDRRASLIVIHDGPDNCRQDSCAIARRIAASHPGMPIHLVSLGLDEAAAGAVACIAEETGGKIFPVGSLSDIQPMIDQAVKLAMTGPVPVPSPVSRREAQQAERGRSAHPNIPADGPPHLLVSATLGKSTVVDKPVHWRILRSGEDTTPVLDILDSRFAVPLPAGTYIVEAALGRSQVRQAVEVAERGPTEITVAFNAGIARVTTRMGTDPAVKLPVLVNVAALNDASADTALKPVLVIPSPSSEFVLPAGKYRITAESGLGRASRDVTIEAGQVEPVTLDLNVGQLQLRAVSSAGERLTGDLTYFLSVDDPGAPGGRREVMRTSASDPVLELPAGTYYVKVQSGHYQKYDQIAVGAGSVVQRSIILDAARLRVRANVSLDGQSEAFPIVYRVYSLGPYAREVAMSWDRAPDFTLPPGRYRVVAEIGVRNVEASEEIELAPGAEASIELTARAAQLQMQLAQGISTTSAHRFWEIRTEAGKVIWRTSHLSPSTLLAPGRYEVRCELRDRTLQDTVELAAGQTLTARLGGE